MEKAEVKGSWQEQKARLKRKFAVLTDNDMLFEEGNKEEMMGKLQVKLGQTKEELQRILAAI